MLGGIYWRRASTTGAMLALCGGLTALLALEKVQTVLANTFTAGDVKVVRQWLTGDTVPLGTRDIKRMFAMLDKHPESDSSCEDDSENAHQE